MDIADLFLDIGSFLAKDETIALSTLSRFCYTVFRHHAFHDYYLTSTSDQKDFNRLIKHASGIRSLKIDHYPLFLTVPLTFVQLRSLVIVNCIISDDEFIRGDLPGLVEMIFTNCIFNINLNVEFAKFPLLQKVCVNKGYCQQIYTDDIVLFSVEQPTPTSPMQEEFLSRTDRDFGDIPWSKFRRSKRKRSEVIQVC